MVTLESQIIEHCAPTLAGLKTANMFSCRYETKEEILEQIRFVNRKLNGKDVYVGVLRWRENLALIYVYRREMLQNDLTRPEATRLLSECAYEDGKPCEYLAKLHRRLQDGEDFPHEIGLFLGYPLEDVRGFIINKGRNCELCGIWKVYQNAAQKQKIFDKFRRCSDIYRKVFREGRPIAMMTVAA